NLNGDVAELIYFRGTLTEADRAAVQQYLAQKYLLPSSQGPFTFQWQVNGTTVAGATDSSLSLTNVQIADSGTYSVVVSNLSGATTSSPAVLSVGDAPTLTVQPQNQSVIQGAPASFSVSATGTAPLSYSWTLNGSVIPGATTATLSITNAHFSNDGTYSVVVSSPFGHATSDAATLTVDAFPVITVQPQTQIVQAGSNAVFTVNATVQTDAVMPNVASGTLRLWLKSDAGVLTNATGQVARWRDQSSNSNDALQASTALQPTLIYPSSLSGKPAIHFNGAQNNTTGQYLNGSGDVGIPDAFTAFCVYETVPNANNENLPYFVGVPAQFNAARGLDIAQQTNHFVAWANDYDTGIAVVPNSFRICTDRLNTNLTSVDVVETTSSGSTMVTKTTSGLSTPGAGYYVGGLDTSIQFVSTSRTLAGDVAELIIYRGAVSEGDRLAVESYLKQKYYQTGTSSGLSYQWQFNGQNILGATNSSLTVSTAQGTNSGNYDVVVCHGTLCTTSSNAQLIVTQYGVGPVITSQPQGQTVVTGSTVSFSVGLASGSYSYLWQSNGSTIVGATDSVLNLTNVQVANSGTYNVVVGDGTNYVASSNAVLAVVRPQNPGCTPSPSGIIGWWPAEGDASDFIANDNGTLVNNVGFIPGEVGQAFNLSGNSYVSIPDSAQVRPTSVTIAGWFAFTQVSGVQVLVGKTVGTGPNDSYVLFYQSGTLSGCVGNLSGIGPIVTYQLNPTANTWYHLAYTFDNATKQQALYVNGVLQASGANSTAIGYDTHPLMIGAEYENESVQFFMTGKADEVTLFNRALTASELQQIYIAGAGGICNGLLIGYNPQNQSAAVGTSATFSVQAGGSAPINYQWLKNGATLATANGSSLIFPSVQPTDAGTYAVVVSNFFGSLTSSNAVLTVGFAPAISTQPVSQTVIQSNTLSFAVAASGTDPIAYQWKLNGSAIAAATNSILTIASAQTTNNGSYSVIITNLFGSITSSNAALRVDIVPQILGQPQSQSIIAGATATFAVGTDAVLPAVASGTLRLWLKADAGVVTNANSQVSRWSDQSPNGNHANQNNISQQPVLVRPAAINGRAALRFDGFQSSSSGDYLIGTNDVGIPDAFTSFVVAEPASLSSANVPVFVGTPGTTGAGRAYSLNSGQLNFATWANDYTTGLVPKVGTYRIWTERFSTNRTFAEMFDGTATNSTNFSWTIANTQTPAAQYYIGGLGSFTRNFAGDIAEVIYYRGTLNDSDRLAVEGYLRQKYYQAIPLSGLTYQWQYNGINIAGATNTTLTVSNAQPAAAGSYTVGVCNGSACVTSSNAMLTVNIPPFITQQPIDQNVIVGTAASFTANADGTGPLSYQWKHNAANIVGATNTSLSIASAQQSDAGTYALVVSSPYGTATSSNAVLSVITSTLIVENVSGSGSSTIQVPVLLSALGNEHALGFSLNFDPTLLSISSIDLGSNASGATIFANTNQQSSGRAGVVVSFTSGETFAAGTQQVAVITFDVGIVATNVVTSITLGDSPTVRQISDALAHSLPGTYIPGSATLSQTVFEGDVAPRPSGDQGVTITDWVQVGRFVAGLDAVASDSEFQRVDCAPRNNLGNGKLTVSDWVQAGRYAVGLDALTPVGGPTTISGNALIKPRVPTTRAVTLQTGSTNGPTNVVSVQLNSQGDESAIGFSLTFDSSLVRFAGAALGSNASGASMNVNASGATNGNLGVALELPFGKTFTAGAREVVRLSFVPIVYSPGNSNLTFTDSPVIREVSDATANALSANYVNNTLSTIGLLPVLYISQDGAGNVTMSWAAAANGYGLESVSDLSTNWLPVSTTAVTNGANVFVTQPAATNQLYFRLHRP
ncbi:MAG: Conserved repeat domain protein, partial [Verrucomicrobiales bacterium]|nr:Conserved repeat domain protein [Verrucomicrobiales bacterium]